MHAAHAFLFLVLAQPAPPVILPDVTPPTPPPQPTPAVTPLASDQLYVVRASVVCTVLASPDGLVKVASDEGPVKVGGKFVGGSGGFELRTFTDKYVYIVSAVGPGQCELLVIPQGGVVTRRTLLVGGAPLPPGPTPPADPLTAKLQAAYTADQDRDRATSLAFLVQAYQGMAAQAPARAIATNADLYSWLKGVIQAPGVGLAATQVVALRTAVAAELTAALGTSGTAPLTPQAAAAELGRIAAALGRVR